jgi:hypothetical protein
MNEMVTTSLKTASTLKQSHNVLKQEANQLLRVLRKNGVLSEKNN